MPLAMLIVVPGFVVHELAHKLTAILYGLRAKFQIWIPGLIVTMISALLPIKLIMPGAVYLLDNPKNTEESAYIALAGPLGNIALALLASQISDPLAFQIVSMNLLIAILNMIPVPPLDGWRIKLWDFRKWLLIFTVLLLAYLIYILWRI
jgi:Zn-dependent protease